MDADRIMEIVNGLDNETYESMGKVIFGHEMWIENASEDQGRFSADLMYGHNMVSDGTAPREYVNPVVLDSEGNPIPSEVSEIRNGYRISFEGNGRMPYTMYVESLPVTWNHINDGTWRAGLKRDFSDVKSSASYHMCAKAVFADSAPSATEQTLLEIISDRPCLEEGCGVGFRVLYEGRPLSGKEMKAFCRGTGREAYGRTDDAGEVSFRIDHAGEWMFLMRHRDSDKFVEDEFDETVLITTLVMRS